MWHRAREPLDYKTIEALLPEVKGYLLASLFRPAFVRALIEDRHAGIVREMGLMRLAEAGATLADLFEWAYRRLRLTYRCEYIYKNEILHRLFLARHNPARASVASEFPIGCNRLELLVVNATTVAYEVKTQYDDLARLPAQTAAYMSVFDRVNVVCDPTFLEQIRSLVDERVGIIVFTSAGSMRIDRPSVQNTGSVNPTAIFDVLRMSEYVDAVRSLFGAAPSVPNTERRRTYREYFKRLSPQTAHQVLVKCLRARFADREAERVKTVPYSMVQMYYESVLTSRSSLFEAVSLCRPLLE